MVAWRVDHTLGIGLAVRRQQAGIANTNRSSVGRLIDICDARRHHPATRGETEHRGECPEPKRMPTPLATDPVRIVIFLFRRC